MSAPGAFIWAGDHSALQGFPLICQHLPLRAFVGLTIDDECEDPDWKLSVFPEDHLSYSSITDDFSTVRWRTAAEGGSQPPMGDVIDRNLNRLRESNRYPALKNCRVRVLTLCEISRGGTNWSGAMAAAIAGALFVADRLVQPQKGPESERLVVGAGLSEFSDVWDCALELESDFQEISFGKDGADITKSRNASGWAVYSSIANTERPFVFSRSLISGHQLAEEPYELGPRTAPRGVTVGVVRTVRARESHATSDTTRDELSNRYLFPQYDALNSVIRFAEGVPMELRADSRFFERFNRVLQGLAQSVEIAKLAGSYDDPVRTHTDEAYGLWLATIAASTLDTGMALENLLGSDTGAKETLTHKDRIRRLAQAMRRSHSSLVALSRDWFEGDAVAAAFYRTAHKFGISRDSAIKIHGWGRGGSLVFAIPTRWEDVQLSMFMDEFLDQAQTDAQSSVGIDWCSLIGNDHHGLRIERTFGGGGRILIGSIKSVASADPAEKVFLRLGASDSASSASIVVFGASGTGKSRLIEQIIAEYRKLGTVVFWIWAKDKPVLSDWGLNLTKRGDTPEYVPLDFEEHSEDLPTVNEDDPAISELNRFYLRAAASTRSAFGADKLSALSEASSGIWYALWKVTPKLEEVVARSVVPLEDLPASPVFAVDLTAWPDDLERSVATSFMFSWLQMRFRSKRELLLPVKGEPPRLVIVDDEAHRVAALGSLDRILREGRSAGLATLLATQETKDLRSLAHAETVVSFRVDPESARHLAVTVEVGALKQEELAEELMSLPRGRAVMFHGGSWREQFGDEDHSDLQQKLPTNTVGDDDEVL